MGYDVAFENGRLQDQTPLHAQTSLVVLGGDPLVKNDHWSE